MNPIWYIWGITRPWNYSYNRASPLLVCLSWSAVHPPNVYSGITIFKWTPRYHILKLENYSSSQNPEIRGWSIVPQSTSTLEIIVKPDTNLLNIHNPCSKFHKYLKFRDFELITKILQKQTGSVKIKSFLLAATIWSRPMKLVLQQ